MQVYAFHDWAASRCLFPSGTKLFEGRANIARKVILRAPWRETRDWQHGAVAHSELVTGELLSVPRNSGRNPPPFFPHWSPRPLSGGASCVSVGPSQGTKKRFATKKKSSIACSSNPEPAAGEEQELPLKQDLPAGTSRLMREQSQSGGPTRRAWLAAAISATGGLPAASLAGSAGWAAEAPAQLVTYPPPEAAEATIWRAPAGQACDSLTGGTLGLTAWRNPRINQGLAMGAGERDLVQVRGLLPAAVVSPEMEIRRALAALDRINEPLLQYQFLVSLQQRQEGTFFGVLLSDLDRWLPIVYTPTVGDACLNFSTLSPRPLGMYVTPADNTRGRIDELLAPWAADDISIAVITDGERVLGLGDLGAHGLGIVAGKSIVYSACGGIPPEKILPIAVDVGSENQKLREGELYIGLRQPRLRGEPYLALMDNLVRGLQRKFGDKIIIHWEDVGSRNSFDLLERYSSTAVTLNDDIQCTAGVALAGILGALRITGGQLSAQRVLLFGAGQANIGIARLLRYALTQQGLPEATAARQISMMDSDGLIFDGRAAPISRQKRPFSVQLSPQEAPSNPLRLLSCVECLKPTILIGAAGKGGAFDEPVLRAMAALNDRPIVFALSNPLSQSECTAEEALRWTGGRAVFASGTKFPPVRMGGKTFDTGFANNAFVFPGVGLGAIVSGATSISAETFFAAAQSLAAMVDDADLASGCVFPAPSRIRQVALEVAASTVASARLAMVASARDKASSSCGGKALSADLKECIRGLMYNPYKNSL